VRARRRLGALGGVLAAASAAALVAGSGATGADPTTTVAPTTTTTTTTTTSTSTTTTSSSVPSRDPFATASVARYLRSRRDDLTAGLYDVATGQTFLYRPGVPEVTASMSKIDILAVLLHEAQVQRRTLSPAEQRLAATMIEVSGNRAAQRLWNDVGGHGLSRRIAGSGGTYAVRAFNARLGLAHTVTDWGWGLMATTPADFLKLMAAIWLPGPTLPPSSQAYERGLMEGVTPSQRFGVPNGVPVRAVVGVKDGWYHERATGWQVNSAGYVHLGAVTYLAVVMTARNPDERYGIDTVNTVGELLWRAEYRIATGRQR
jgi:Beta-lactamase enzyme family